MNGTGLGLGDEGQEVGGSLRLRETVCRGRVGGGKRVCGEGAFELVGNKGGYASSHIEVFYSR